MPALQKAYGDVQFNSHDHGSGRQRSQDRPGQWRHPPPVPGGGGGDHGGNGSPDYGARLRRTRLGLIVGLVASTMLFVSFTSVYIVRRGLPTLDDRTGTYVRDWLPVSLPTTCSW